LLMQLLSTEDGHFIGQLNHGHTGAHHHTLTALVFNQ